MKSGGMAMPISTCMSTVSGHCATGQWLVFLARLIVRSFRGAVDPSLSSSYLVRAMPLLGPSQLVSDAEF